MQDLDPFLQAWYLSMAIGAIIFIALAIIIYLVHNLKVALIRDFKTKYDYLNSHEVGWYKMSFYSVGIAVGLLINMYGSGAKALNTVGVWFFVRLFFGVAGAT